MSSVQQSWSGSSDRARVRIRRASAMISSLSRPISGRRMGSVTASSSAVRLVSVWLLTWPSESPVTSAAAPRRRASTSPVLSIRRRCATICSRLAPDEASFCCVLPNATTHSRESHWKRCCSVARAWRPGLDRWRSRRRTRQRHAGGRHRGRHAGRQFRHQQPRLVHLHERQRRRNGARHGAQLHFERRALAGGLQRGRRGIGIGVGAVQWQHHDHPVRHHNDHIRRDGERECAAGSCHIIVAGTQQPPGQADRARG